MARKLSRPQQKLLISVIIIFVVVLVSYTGISSKLGLSGLFSDQQTTVSSGSSTTSSDPATGSIVTGQVISVVDGDTMHIQINSRNVKVRLVGVNAPEDTNQHEPYGPEATAYARQILPVGKRIWVEVAKESHDRYGRLLAYLWLEEPPDGSATLDPNVLARKMVSARILEQGWGKVLIIKPNIKYRSQYEALQRQAKRDARGIWQ